MDFSPLLTHPDKEEIIAKILKSTDVNDIHNWLKLKYPDKEQKHLILSLKILKEFSKSQYTDVYHQMNQDIQLIKNGEGDKVNKKIADSLLNNKTYHERLNEAVEEDLNIRKMLHSTITIIQDRAIQLFDLIQSNPAMTKTDYVLIKWIEQLISAFEKYDKIVNKSPDQVIQHQFSIQIVDQYLACYHEAIRKTLGKLDPAAAAQFLDFFATEMSKVKPPTDGSFSMEDQHQQMHLLQAQLNKIKD